MQPGEPDEPGEPGESNEPGEPGESDGVRSPLPHGVAWVASALFATAGLVLTAGQTVLYGDGSYYLLTVMQTGRVVPIAGRFTLNAARESPLLLGLLLGIDNTRLLSYLLGLGQVLLPAVAWAVAVLLARRNAVQFLLVTVAGAICFSSTIFFSVSELTLALPLVAIVTVLLARNQPLTPWTAVLALAACVVLLASHEAILICSAILAVQAVLRGRLGLSRLDMACSWAVAALSMAAVAISVWTLVLYPNANSVGFLSMLTHLQPMSTLLILFAGISLIAAQLVGAERSLLRIALWEVCLGTLAFGVFLALDYSGRAAYGARSYSVLIMVAFQGTMILLVYRSWRTSQDLIPPVRPQGWAPWFTVAFLTATLVVPLWPLGGWSASLYEFRTVVTTRQGFVDPQDSLSPQTQSFTYPWTNPSLSVVLRSRVGDAIVTPGTDPGWKPFPLTAAHDQLDAKYTWR